MLFSTPPNLFVSIKFPVHFVQKANGHYFIDFGKNYYGNLKIVLRKPPATISTQPIIVHPGEKTTDKNTIDRKPFGSVNYRRLELNLQPEQMTYQLLIPPKPQHNKNNVVKMRADIGEVTPFRYVELENVPFELKQNNIQQLAIHVPFDDKASSFTSSDPTLTAIWDLCKHTFKATSAFGIYIDGERERIAYEADAYINQIGHYVVDNHTETPRRTLEHLFEYPTWPIEWSFHTVMMAYADYEYTGQTEFIAKHYETLKQKLLLNRERPDGLLKSYGIVDWPPQERDGYGNGQQDPRQRNQVGPEVNTVVNAFYYHCLHLMTKIAITLNKPEDATLFQNKSQQLYTTFNKTFFNQQQQLYTDGLNSEHASLHANMFPLTFGLIPKEHQQSVISFIKSKGMACSVYGAQYLLEGLYKANEGDYAQSLITSHSERSWYPMIERGSTTTWEAWSEKFKPNLTWNHAWGAVPAYIIARYLMGIRPLEPGFKKIIIQPQLGNLTQATLQLPTPRGKVTVAYQNKTLTVTLPKQTVATVIFANKTWEISSGKHRLSPNK